MTTIWKYTIEKDKRFQIVKMPESAEILDLQYQNDQLAIWAYVGDTDAPVIEVGILMYGTGWEIKEDLTDATFLKTIQDDNGLVWHFFMT